MLRLETLTPGGEFKLFKDCLVQIICYYLQLTIIRADDFTAYDG